MSIRVLLDQANLTPDYVVLGEPTTLRIFRGHRGHAEISVIIADHNAPQITAQVVLAIGSLDETLFEDPILGKGSVTVKRIETEYNPCKDVPKRCRILVDRRLTQGETAEDAIKEIKAAIDKLGLEAQVEIEEYREPSWRGYTPRVQKATPSYLLDEEHELVQTATRAIGDALGWEPEVTKRRVDLDSCGTAGLAHLPVIAFGPGDEAFAHTMQEHVYIQDMVDSANAYAQMAVELIGLAK
jgi:putative selenium metabolism hydrolase